MNQNGRIAKNTENTELNIGGQAVIEGVMLRGRRYWVAAVRNPSGQIVFKAAPVPNWAQRFPFLRWPLLRGAVGLVEAVTIGFKSLSYSAQVAAGEEVEIGSKEMAFSTAIGFLLAIGLFLALPVWLTGWLNGFLSKALGSGGPGVFVHNLIEGAVRISIFFAYLMVMATIPDVRRVFEYHGAEHKTVHAFEHQQPLAPETVSRFSTEHVRCGTAFLLIVMIIAIFVFSLLGQPSSILTRIGLRLLVLPLVAGIAYEVIKFAGRHESSKLVKIVMSPGLWLQRLTTREPTSAQLEVAIFSLQELLKLEKVTGLGDKDGRKVFTNT